MCNDTSIVKSSRDGKYEEEVGGSGVRSQDDLDLLGPLSWVRKRRSHVERS